MITKCKHCGCDIDTELGEHSPNGDHVDPRAPGDWDDICDYCNYVKGLRGGPNSQSVEDDHADDQ